MIRILLVDDQELVRAGLRPLAERDGDISVVGEAADGRSAIARCRELRPDVVLMDLSMPGMNGVEATRELAADPELASTGVLVLTTFDDDADLFDAIRAGADGYLLKDVSPAELRRAIRAVAAGGSLLDPAVAGRVMRAATAGRGAALPAELTEREAEVFALVGRGLSNEEIAKALFLSPATARTYVSRLLAKLDARDRAALIVLAYETGAVRPGDR
ncbi:response regulator transcription factor [Gulosibacter sp. 10]|uniref:response regulator n=1 Tax=Gulosibacter sp. 10 TaxID=1255570 RepID=UPI00097F3441|nr:response regulator transcription factor [Gulosibacter sp. 10]SJM65016.1 DNA-binding response regulator, LuxR family [Gulosibacter sp. 10]